MYKLLDNLLYKIDGGDYKLVYECLDKCTLNEAIQEYKEMLEWNLSFTQRETRS